MIKQQAFVEQLAPGAIEFLFRTLTANDLIVHSYFSPVLHLQNIADEAVSSTALNKILLCWEELFRIDITVFLKE
jgi:hypothetical protein